MSVEEVQKIVHHEPFRPYRVVLDDGEQLVVRKARKSHFSGDVVSLLGESQKKGGVTVTRFRIVPIEKIMKAEHVAAQERRS